MVSMLLWRGAGTRARKWARSEVRGAECILDPPRVRARWGCVGCSRTAAPRCPNCGTFAFLEMQECRTADRAWATTTRRSPCGGRAGGHDPRRRTVGALRELLVAVQLAGVRGRQVGELLRGPADPAPPRVQRHDRVGEARGHRRGTAQAAGPSCSSWVCPWCRTTCGRVVWPSIYCPAVAASPW